MISHWVNVINLQKNEKISHTYGCGDECRKRHFYFQGFMWIMG